MGRLQPEVAIAVDDLITSFLAEGLDVVPLETVAGSGDARLAWVLSDLLRFLQGSHRQDDLVEAFQRLTGSTLGTDPAVGNRAWTNLTDTLIAWDLPAPPGYRELKARIFLAIEPRWAPFFEDADAAIDWRLVSWGGVLIDDRHLGGVAGRAPSHPDRGRGRRDPIRVPAGAAGRP